MVKIGPLELTVTLYDAEELAKREVKVPERGRCADRIEDFFMVLGSGWNSSLDQYTTVVQTMVECLRSEPGEEPRGKYVLLTPQDPSWKDHAHRPSKYVQLKALREQDAMKQAQEQQQQQQQSLGSSRQGKQQFDEQPAAQQGLRWLWWWRRRQQQPKQAGTAD